MVKNKEIKEAKRELFGLSQDEENQRIADFREREIMDRKDIYETGKDAGKEETKKDIIINLLKMKMPTEKIIKITKATKEEIEKIKEEEDL